MEDIMIVQLQNQGNLTGMARCRCFKKSKGGRVGVATGFDRQLKVVIRIVARGIDGETSRRAMLKALVHGQNDEFACSRQAAVVQESGKIGLGPGISLSYQLRISRTRSVMCRATAWRSSVRVCIIAMDGLPLEFLQNLSYHAVLFSGMAGATCASGSV